MTGLADLLTRYFEGVVIRHFVGSYWKPDARVEAAYFTPSGALQVQWSRRARVVSGWASCR